MKTLVNVGRRRCMISLDHPEFHRRSWGFTRQLVCTNELNPKNGRVGRLEQRKACAGVLSLLAGASKSGFPDSIAAVPDVVRLVRAGLLMLVDEVLSVVEPPPKNGSVRVEKNGVKTRKVE